jgi:uroporphyrinogen decarboxylase
VILFSDILTPLTGMNIPFDILKFKGPVIHNPVRSLDDVAQVQPLDPEAALPYVGETLRILRSEVGGAPLAGASTVFRSDPAA